MQRTSEPKDAAQPPRQMNRKWVQTERQAHMAWARFSIRKPTASAVLHQLIAHMGPQNAVVITQKMLARLIGVTDRTIRTALADLEADRWIQVVRLGRGKECAYVVNDRVAWGQSRDDLRLSTFSATVVVDRGDQDEGSAEEGDLRSVSLIFKVGEDEQDDFEPAVSAVGGGRR